MKKKILPVLLALVMVTGLLPMPASATQNSDECGIEFVAVDASGQEIDSTKVNIQFTGLVHTWMDNQWTEDMWLEIPGNYAQNYTRRSCNKNELYFYYYGCIMSAEGYKKTTVVVDMRNYPASDASDNEGYNKIYVPLLKDNETYNNSSANIYPINVVSEHGSVETLVLNKGASLAAPKDEVTIIVDPDSGYNVKTVTVKKGDEAVSTTQGSDGEYTFTMPSGAVAVEVEYETNGEDTGATKQYEIITKQTNYSTGEVVNDWADVTFQADGKTVTEVATGQNVSVVATPQYGYEVKSITVKQQDGTAITQTQNSSASFRMPASRIIVTVEVLRSFYSITAGSTSNGSVSVSTSAYVGTTVTVTPNAADGYVVGSVTYTSNSKTETITKDSNGKYTFTMPNGPVTVNATFIPESEAPEAPDGIQMNYTVYATTDDGYKTWGSGKLELSNLEKNCYYTIQLGSHNDDDSSTAPRVYQVMNSGSEGKITVRAQRGAKLWLFKVGENESSFSASMAGGPVEGFSGITLTPQ